MDPSADGTTTAADPPGDNPLTGPDQQVVMERASELVASDIVSAQVEAVVGDLEQGADPTGARDYVEQLALTQAIRMAASDPYRPLVAWGAFPGSKFALDHPDTMYRSMAVAADGSYEITGRRNTSSFLTFQVMDTFPGDGGSLGTTLSFLDDTDLEVDPDGTFRVTLDAAPAGDRANHLQLTAESEILLIRDTVADWVSETPAELDVEMVAPTAPPPAPSTEALEGRTAAAIAEHAPFWLTYVDAIRGGYPVNTLSAVQASFDGLPRQHTAIGHYSLGADEALVISFGTGAASYAGLMLGTDWFISADYVDHTSSLNTTQAIANPDGSVTMVLSQQDPGVSNWLDPGSNDTGIIFVRWLGAAEPPASSQWPTTRVVPIDDLPGALPSGTPRGTPADREAALASRRAGVQQRIEGLPAPYGSLSPPG